MKKIIGILGVAVIAATMFFNTNNVNNSSSDASLASLLSINSANAQNSEAPCDKAGTEQTSKTNLLYTNETACFDKDQNHCGDAVECEVGNKLPISPASSSCTPATCI